MSKLKNEHENDEAWLRAGADAMRPDFEAMNKPLPPVMRFDFGFTGHGVKKTDVSGQFWEGSASSDGIPKIIIRANTDDPVAILEALDHQLVHAAVGAQEGHGKMFREVALRLGLDPPMRTSKAGKRLRERLHALAEDLGPFPNARLNFETRGPDGHERRVADKPEKQESRQLKAECLIDGCGYIVRVSALHLRRGAPVCPIHLQPMRHDELPPEPEKKPVADAEEGDPVEAAGDDESAEDSMTGER